MADMIFPEKLDDDVREAWEWWFKRKRGGSLCPATRSDFIVFADCNAVCAPIFPGSTRAVMDEYLRNDEQDGMNCPCPCNRIGPFSVRAHIEAVLNGK